jgi:hypothetical protein
MVLNYLPLNYEKTYEFIYDECGYNDCISTEEIIYELLDDGFCKYIYKNGKSEGQMCLRKIHKKNNYYGKYKKYCGVHRYVLERHDLRIELKKNKQKIKCKFNKCNNLIKHDKLCNKHLKIKTKMEDFYENSINNFCQKNNKYYEIDYCRYYYPWTINIKIKELEYKKIQKKYKQQKLICYKNKDINKIGDEKDSPKTKKLNIINTNPDNDNKYKLEYYLSNIIIS